MPFPKRIPTTIGMVRIEVTDMPAQGAQTASQRIVAYIELQDASGSIKTESLDLEQYLTPAQLANIKAFAAQVRTKAQTELL